MVAPLVRRIAGPTLWADLGALAARWHSHVHRAEELRPSTMLKLLEAADAFHRPERLDSLLIAAQADHCGRTGREAVPYPQAGIVRAARAAASAITARDLIAEGHLPGPRLAETLFGRRAKAIRAALGHRRTP